MALLIAERKPPFWLILAQAQSTTRPQWRTAQPAPTSLRTAEATDAELVSQHLAGDPGAFAELVKRYTRSIYNVTYRFTSDAHEAENLTQETFLRAWNALPRVSLDKPLKPYFIKIAVNLCRDWAERNKMMRLTPLEIEDETVWVDEASDPLDTVSDKELQGLVRTKLDDLPALYRTVLSLRYAEELSYEEIASALDIPVNTVRVHLHRAKVRLRELLENEG
jgi:RNA polymerase sigma-70 factor, ECF subfamily